MSYCTQTDIENIFGRDNVAIWSNLDNDSLEADAARIAAAIAWADTYIDGRLRNSRYALPLRSTSGSLTAITNLAARVAGVWLYEARAHNEAGGDDHPSSRLAGIRRQADQQIDRYLTGRDHLDAIRRRTAPDSPVVV